MKSFLKSWALAAILMGTLTNVLAPRAAAQTGSIGGTILDVNGNPWAEDCAANRASLGRSTRRQHVCKRAHQDGGKRPRLKKTLHAAFSFSRGSPTRCIRVQVRPI